MSASSSRSVPNNYFFALPYTLVEPNLHTSELNQTELYFGFIDYNCFSNKKKISENFDTNQSNACPLLHMHQRLDLCDWALDSPRQIFFFFNSFETNKL